MYYDIVESGVRIKEMRKKRRLTQAQLAEIIGISEDAVSSIERGIHGASVDTFGALADALNCSAEYLEFGVYTAILTDYEWRIITAVRENP